MFTVYSKPACPQCDTAKSLIKSLGHDYREVVLDVGQPKSEGTEYIAREDLLQLIPTARTMPQIYDGVKRVGGLAELKTWLAA
jgi:glutaredoxin 3